VNLAAGAFQCFTYGAAGDQLDLWSEIHAIDALPDGLRISAIKTESPIPTFEQRIGEDTLPLESEKRIAPRSLGKEEVMDST
jgi:hypothetical protein